jgi:phosphoribosylglycinamide formyltransferase-1
MSLEKSLKILKTKLNYMAQSIGSNKVKTAVFISGTGSNLKSLIKFSKVKNSPIIISMIISNNAKSKGLNYGKMYKIKKKVFDFKNTLSENKVINELEKNKINLICLAGFMKILSKNFIKNFNGKIINIHPSLLPKYKGLNTHEKAIKNKDKYSGCTVHFVSSRLDSGKIINQKKVRIIKSETPKTLAKKILIQEHKLYPKAITKILSL